ncbi:MAG: hypothetical protein ACRD50_06495 [Candidatus Acidiferrales bacterium]
MRVDRKQRSWAIWTLIFLGVALAAYIFWRLRDPFSPRPASRWGLAYGIAGFALMLFEGLLSARRKVPTWRLGRGQWWMRAHVWLGLLALPLILFHSGFQFGGTLTSVLMWLFIIVVVSGILGVFLQNYVPRKMMTEVPMETIYEQIGHVRDQLAAEAKQIVEAACGSLESGDVQARPTTLFDTAALGKTRAAAVAEPVELDEEALTRLRQFYHDQLHPFLAHPADKQHALGDKGRATAIFEHLRILLPPVLHEKVTDLEDICEEEREFTQEARLHVLLHSWLLVHIPLSFALLLLGAIHAVVALKY